MKSLNTQQETVDLLLWLKAHGCPVDITELESSIWIEQASGDDVTMLFDLPDGRVGYLLDLRIINKGPGFRSIQGLEFKMPWSGCGFQLLQDPRESSGRRPADLYRFPGTSIEFPRDEVLNHILVPNGILHANHPKSGLLMGIGKPISPEIRHGGRFTGLLTIFTDTGAPGTCEIELWANRAEQRGADAYKRPPEYNGLFERDPGMEGDFAGHDNP